MEQEWKKIEGGVVQMLGISNCVAEAGIPMESFSLGCCGHSARCPSTQALLPTWFLATTGWLRELLNPKDAEQLRSYILSEVCQSPNTSNQVTALYSGQKMMFKWKETICQKFAKWEDELKSQQCFIAWCWSWCPQMFWSLDLEVMYVPSWARNVLSRLWGITLESLSIAVL